MEFKSHEECSQYFQAAFLRERRKCQALTEASKKKMNRCLGNCQYESMVSVYAKQLARFRDELAAAKERERSAGACPHCGKPIPKSLAASTLGSIKSPRRSAASRANGKLGGRPRKPRQP